MHTHVDLEFVLHLLDLAGALLPELTSEEVLAKMCRQKARLAVKHTASVFFPVVLSNTIKTRLVCLVCGIDRFDHATSLPSVDSFRSLKPHEALQKKRNLVGGCACLHIRACVL